MSRPKNAAILFAPLRVVPIYEGAAFEVHTKQDDTPGSKNNFVLCLCQQKEEADLFAAAPDLLASAISAEQILARLARELQTPAFRELCRDAATPLRNAIAKAEGRT